MAYFTSLHVPGAILNLLWGQRGPLRFLAELEHLCDSSFFRRCFLDKLIWPLVASPMWRELFEDHTFRVHFLKKRNNFALYTELQSFTVKPQLSAE